MQVKNYTTRHQYNEAEALQQLLAAVNNALDAQNKRFEQQPDDYIDEEFTITVNGIQTAFILGGPQSQALFEFIQHIADENFYAVDFNNAIVEE